MKKLLTSCTTPLILALLAATPVLADFSWDIDRTGAVSGFFELESFHTVVTNTGSVPDTVLVHMAKDTPPEWVASLCEEDLCYPPFLVDIALELAPGQSIALLIDITPITVAGQGSSDITLTSTVNPAQVVQQRFTVLTPGLDVLLVDAAGNGAATLVGAAVAATGASSGVWNVADMGKATATDLASYPTVIWTSGGLLTGLDTADMTILGDHVTAGGHLLLSGQNLLFAYADPISPFYDPAARDWFRQVVGADYVANLGSLDTVSAPVGDPLFAGATYAINGGDGSDDNISPDVVAPWGGAAGSLAYSGGGQAAVWNLVGSGKVLFAGFGIEGIASAAARDDFLARSLDWFASGASAVGDTPAAAPLIVRAWPNPFNPQTTIRFDVGGDRALPVAVDIHDVSGRLVRRLVSGRVAPGPRSVLWDGRDDAGRHLATGVYLARVRVGERQDVLKLALVK